MAGRPVGGGVADGAAPELTANAVARGIATGMHGDHHEAPAAFRAERWLVILTPWRQQGGLGGRRLIITYDHNPGHFETLPLMT